MSRVRLIRAALLGAVSALITVLLLSCAPELVRLGPGDCVVLVEKHEVITAGSGCEVKRLYR